MDADITVASADETLEGGLLLVVEHFACGAQKDDRFELRKVGVIEGSGVFSLFDVERILLAELPDGRNALRN
jgi:hypothetical protein